ncbi:MAG TPA: hypothetical protein DEZ09_04250 [Holosporales bacterium]|nr:MAG: hypothetical protein A2065_02340 [Alphaproteobacteria bacterium GWB1_45_5]HCI49028.1 hypothetical protein [Holosporales bacterium]
MFHVYTLIRIYISCINNISTKCKNFFVFWLFFLQLKFFDQFVFIGDIGFINLSTESLNKKSYPRINGTQKNGLCA